MNAPWRAANDCDRVAIDRSGLWRAEEADHVRDLFGGYKMVDRIAGRHLFFDLLRWHTLSHGPSDQERLRFVQYA